MAVFVVCDPNTGARGEPSRRILAGDANRYDDAPLAWSIFPVFVQKESSFMRTSRTVRVFVREQ